VRGVNSSVPGHSILVNAKLPVVGSVVAGLFLFAAATECDQLATTLDLLPTIAALTGTALPGDRRIDGVDIANLLADPTSKSPREEFLYYSKRGDLECIRQGNWKLRRRKYRLKRGAPKLENPPEFNYELYDLSKDIGEKNNLADKSPDLVAKLNQRMQELDAEIEKSARAPWAMAVKKTRNTLSAGSL